VREDRVVHDADREHGRKVVRRGRRGRAQQIGLRSLGTRTFSAPHILIAASTRRSTSRDVSQVARHRKRCVQARLVVDLSCDGVTAACRRLLTTTLASCLAKRLAIPAPIPLVEPVTRAVLPRGRKAPAWVPPRRAQSGGALWQRWRPNPQPRRTRRRFH
jgi:hypothetical protein